MNPAPLATADLTASIRFHQRVWQAGRPSRLRLVDVAFLGDVVLLVLMFFILGSALVRRPGVRVDLPDIPGAEGLAQPLAVITLAQENMVFFNDERTTLDGLAAAMEREKVRLPDLRVLIEADGAVRHQDVAKVIEMARSLQIGTVALATRIHPEERRLP